MSDFELLQLIIDSIKRDNNPIKESVIKENSFIKDPRNVEFIGLYNSSDFKENYEWHQVVRFALKKDNALQYMYDKLWSLLNEYRSYQDFFEVDTELGSHPIINPLTELNRFETLYLEFFEIFRNISNQIHFDYPQKQYSGPYLQGNVDWKKTLEESETSFPTNFISTMPYRKFDTPENILLSLCIKWMHHECIRILGLDFKEPLDERKKNILILVSERTRHLISNFPFQDVLKSAMKYWDLPYNDARIYSLEHQTRERIENGKIRNMDYSKLLKWINKFRDLNLWLPSEQTPVENLLKSQESQDTIYEVWIFFEFFDFFVKNGMNPILNMDREKKIYNFEFEYDDTTIIFHYEKYFSRMHDPEYVWAIDSWPDFTVMVNDKIIAIFDAKNYARDMETHHEAIRQMLAFLSNFNTKFGVMFFPYRPKFWDDMNEKGRKDLLRPLYEKNNPGMTPEQVAQIPKPESKKEWLELNPDVQKIAPPNSVYQYDNPKDKDMKLCLMRMEPSESEIPRKMKEQTMRTVFEEIVRRIPMIIKSTN